MVWLEDEAANATPPGSALLEVAFRVDCPTIAEDHAAALYGVLRIALPWLAGEPGTGIHSLHGGASGNGWQRPERAEGGDGILHLSKRTRLTLRVPAQRIAETVALAGQRLEVGDYPLRIGVPASRALQPNATQFARRVVCEAGEDEAAFIARMVGLLADRNVAVRKLLCGRPGKVMAPDGRTLGVRSVMLAELSPTDAIAVQSFSPGGFGHLGCGLFLPHKSIAPVGDSDSARTPERG